MNATTAPHPHPMQTPSDGAPSDNVADLQIAKKRKTPRRFQLFDDNQGDFRVYEVIPPGHKTLPAGSLVPLPEFGGFPDAIAAKKGLRAKGAGLQGKTLLVFRGVEIVRITVETRPQVRIESKPRKQVSGPVTDGGSPQLTPEGS